MLLEVFAKVSDIKEQKREHYFDHVIGLSPIHSFSYSFMYLLLSIVFLCVQVHVCTCVWKSEDSLRVLHPAPSTVCLRVSHCLELCQIAYISRPVISRDPSVFISYLTLSLGLQKHPARSRFPHGFWRSELMTSCLQGRCFAD